MAEGGRKNERVVIKWDPTEMPLTAPLHDVTRTHYWNRDRVLEESAEPNELYTPPEDHPLLNVVPKCLPATLVQHLNQYDLRIRLSVLQCKQHHLFFKKKSARPEEDERHTLQLIEELYVQVSGDRRSGKGRIRRCAVT